MSDKNPHPRAGQAFALADLATVLAADAVLLGLDVGTVRIGIARASLDTRIATPLAQIECAGWRADTAALAALAEAHAGAGFVIGLPVQMDGVEGAQARSTRRFATRLAGVARRPYAFWDERLSTAAVERVLTDTLGMRRDARREVRDAAAAAYILQGALDSLPALAGGAAR